MRRRLRFRRRRAWRGTVSQCRRPPREVVECYEVRNDRRVIVRHRPWEDLREGLEQAFAWRTAGDEVF